jgi:carnitine 3-dehydrogenase
MAEIAGVRRVAVIGAGTIGASWAACFLARGLEVVGSDPAPGAEAAVRGVIEAAWPALERLGLAADADRRRWRFVADPVAALAGADFVQESGPEREELKVELFARLDAALPPEAIVASSTSALPMSRIQSGCRHPERCVTGHPFNPPHLIPLVEVVGGARTAPRTIDRAMAFYAGLGKHPVHIRREVMGHLANRLQLALWREALHLVASGVASAADVDAAIAYGPGLRWAVMGPYLTFHLGGGPGGIRHFVEQFMDPARIWWDDLGDPEVTPELQRMVIEEVEAAARGRSVGELAEERDTALIELLALRRRLAGPAAP